LTKNVTKYLRHNQLQMKKDDQIVIIFRTNTPDTACHQITILFPPSCSICFSIVYQKWNTLNRR